MYNVKIGKVGRFYIPTWTNQECESGPFQGITFKGHDIAQRYLQALKEGSAVKVYNYDRGQRLKNGDTMIVNYYHCIYELGGYIREEQVVNRDRLFGFDWFYAWVCAN